MFYLPFNIAELPVRVNLKDSLVSLGSCFTENIGQKLIDCKFTVLTNPFGTIYNPHSIFKVIRQSIDGHFDPEAIMAHEGVYYHWDAHSDLSALDSVTFTESYIRSLNETKRALQNARWLILSLGTSIVYRHIKTDRLVANCHKVPQNEFKKQMLSREEIVQGYLEMMEVLRAFNPGVQAILTVSPVRHVKEGLTENNVSKGILLQAVNSITAGDQNSYYFPAYELMIDVLRDYRFYTEDLVHPNEQAIGYIWEQFVKACMDAETKEFILEWEKIRKSLLHRPFHPSSEKHQKFILTLINKLNALREKTDVSAELKQLENQLINQ